MSGAGEAGRSRANGLAPRAVLLVWSSSALVAVTGLGYGALRYFVRPEDPYAVAHPWQPLAQHLHVLVAPLYVFAAGVLWWPHVVAAWRKSDPARSVSGVLVACTTPPMILSAYLAQVVVDERWRRAAGLAHAGVSLVWLGATLAHLATRRGGRAGPSRTCSTTAPSTQEAGSPEAIDTEGVSA